MPIEMQYESGIWTVDCAGSPAAVGRAHGEQAKAAIGLGMRQWSDAVEERHGVEVDRYVAAFLAATDFLPAIREHTPGLLQEIAGIAEGSGQPAARVLAYNLLDEEWEYAKRGRAAGAGLAPGCTVACLRRGERGAPVLAQTMDIPAVHDGTQVVLRIRPEGRPEVIAYAYAGMIGLMGCNAAGVGVVVNNLEVLPSSGTGLPVAFVTRGILGCRSLDEAATFVTSVPHATGQHYAIGGPDGIHAFEASASGVVEVPASDHAYLHSNHPLVARDVRGDVEATYAASRTRERLDAVTRAAGRAASAGEVEAMLADTTAPVSYENSRGYMTFGAIAMELIVPPAVRVAPGPPHVTAWEDVAWE